MTDAGGNTYSETITLSVNNLMDEGPTDITVDRRCRGRELGRRYGRGNSARRWTPDAGDSFTYS